MRVYLSMVFHCHLPYCRQAGVWPFGEEWVLEAMAETYIPLLALLKNMEGIQVTLGFTPVLLEQLQDPYMQSRFREYLKTKEERAEKDVVRFQKCNERELAHLARQYGEYYRKVSLDYDDVLQGDFIGTLRELQTRGIVELLMGAATHGYLPLLPRGSAIKGQLQTGWQAYQEHFGKQPRGIWLPECGYFPGLEEYLEPLGLEYFIVDGHGIRGGHVDPAYHAPGPTDNQKVSNHFSTLHPYIIKGTSMAAFGRDQLTGLQVWSEDWGYPSDGVYREFHKRDEQSGFHYWRITNSGVKLHAKDIYDVGMVQAKVVEHGDHFVHSLAHRNYDQENPIVVAPYDMELFGHWWREGILWLEHVFTKLAQSTDVQMITPSGYLQKHPPQKSIALPESSWGQGGRHYVWDNGATRWLWSQLEEAMERLERLTAMEVDPWWERVLNQGARECLLLQASDWPFLISTQQASDYASRRFLEHLSRLERLLDGLEKGEHDDEFLGFLQEIEDKDNVFPFINYRVFQPSKREKPQAIPSS